MGESVPFKNVFVLCTGRCGSTTFAKACSHFSNFTVGHETRCSASGDERLAYPQHHIEVDNRLCWFLGRLEEKYGNDAFYVHLVRDERLVAASYEKRRGRLTSIVGAFTHGILCRTTPNHQECIDLVRVMNENIRAFLRNKTHALSINIDEAPSVFPHFAKAIEAQGDVSAALTEFSNRYNSSADTRDSQPHDIASVSGVSLHCSTLPSKREPPIHSSASIEETPPTPAPLPEHNASGQYQDRHLHSELATLRKKLKRARTLGLCLAAPWILLFLPISIPLLLFLRIRKRRRKDHRKKITVQTERLSSQKSVVYDAFVRYHSEGADASIRFLESHRHLCPAGVFDLFGSMSATNDSDWLKAINKWAQASGVPEIKLLPGATPRFRRLAFQPLERIHAPHKVSVIMPAHNSEDTIEQAAQSILAQTWENLELIIVDDCSTDGTRAAIDRIASADQRVRVLANPWNVGPYVSKNRALQIATGRYVTGHDADDIATPSRIAEQMRPVLERPGCAASMAFMMRMNADGVFAYPGRIGTYSYDGVSRRASISLLIDRMVLEEHLGFWDSVRFGADSEMIARVADLFGDKLVDIQRIVMLCLNAETSLTNHPEYGVSLSHGISPIRKAYRDAWTAWHSETKPADRYMPFPHLRRHFTAPVEMTIPDKDLSAAAECIAFAEFPPGRSLGVVA